MYLAVVIHVILAWLSILEQYSTPIEGAVAVAMVTDTTVQLVFNIRASSIP